MPPILFSGNRIRSSKLLHKHSQLSSDFNLGVRSMCKSESESGGLGNNFMSKTAKSMLPSAKFEFADILVSRTDKRGVIQTANELFQSVSGYPWEKLHHAPHKIIRHQDMPKGVFWLFWKMLQNDEPIGAFVKNKSIDGEHYWVFAIATPLDNGYMSVRLKPQGQLFDAVVNSYEKLLADEQSGDTTPEASASVLVELIQDLGFRDYKAFMTKAFIEQIVTRDHELGKPTNPIIHHMTKATEAWENVAVEIHKTIEAFAKFERLPVNMRIQATHLSDAGNAFGVIAGNFTTLTGQIKALMSNLLKSGTELETTLLDGLFLTCIKQVQTEVVDIFRHENGEMGGIDKEMEVSIMQAQNKCYHTKASEGLKAITSQINSFNSMFTSIKTLHSGISVMRVTADIEIRQIKNLQTASLSAIVEELERFLQTEGKRLVCMVDGTHLVHREIKYALNAMAIDDALLEAYSGDLLKAS